MSEKIETQQIKIKFVVANSKGGSGKTTTAIQGLSVYLHKITSNKIDVITLNDACLTSNLRNTSIINYRTVKTKDITQLIYHLESETPCIFDIGGNLTTNRMIQEIGDTESFDDLYWVIPVSDDDVDAMNAKDTFNLIKKADKNARIMIALTQVMNKNNYKEQFIFIFGSDCKEVDFVLFDEIEELPYFTIDMIEKYSLLKDLGKTVYEIGSEEYRNEIRCMRTQNKEKRNKIEKDSDEYRLIEKEGDKITSKLSQANYCLTYREESLTNTFAMIDNNLRYFKNRNSIIKLV